MAGRRLSRWGRVWLAGLWWLALPFTVTESHGCSLAAHATLPVTLRMGVFTLFQPRFVWLRAHDRPAALQLTGQTFRLSPQMTCRIEHTASGLVIWQGNQLMAASDRLTVAAADVTLEVVGRKTRVQRQFQGTLAITALEKCLQLVVTQPVDAVVAAVVSAELPPDAPLEASKALAIVVRSYVAHQVGRHAGEGFDLCDSTHCQLFLGDQWIRQEAGGKTGGKLSVVAQKVAADTAGEVLQNVDATIYSAYFAACCGGRTTSPDVAFGAGLDQSGVACRWCKASRFFTWTRQVDRRRLARALLAETSVTDDIRIEVANRTADGFVASLAITIGSRQIVVPNHRFRHLVGQQLGWNLVLSSRYVIEPRGDALVLRGHGFGHHVGLCLDGSLAQARAGRTHQDILRYYFPQATVGPCRVGR
ncbi:MAG: SpoIID/LytB domain-containing protein [Chloracidobacterium sp.]